MGEEVPLISTKERYLDVLSLLQYWEDNKYISWEKVKQRHKKIVSLFSKNNFDIVKLRKIKYKIKHNEIDIERRLLFFESILNI